jgi:hypothetical protein
MNGIGLVTVKGSSLILQSLDDPFFTFLNPNTSSMCNSFFYIYKKAKISGEKFIITVDYDKKNLIYFLLDYC